MLFDIISTSKIIYTTICVYINDYVWFMVFITTFNNISVISWQLVLLVEKTRVPRENHWPVESHWKLYNIKLYWVHLATFNNISVLSWRFI